jgi:hypothetical protein
LCFSSSFSSVLLEILLSRKTLLIRREVVPRKLAEYSQTVTVIHTKLGFDFLIM